MGTIAGGAVVVVEPAVGGVWVDAMAGGKAMMPTILIFLKAPELGRVKTRLAAEIGDEAALDAYRRLVARQMAALPAGWRVEVQFTPATAEAEMTQWLGQAAGRRFVPQCDGGLGEKLAFAVEGAFDRGARGVFLIGGDCADLGEAEFEVAAAGLHSHDAVLGPSRDGGYYLLGLRTRRPEVFEDIAWSTEIVADQTREKMRQAGISWLELLLLRDVDVAADWRRVEDRV
jgi:rSAM/selenodomain-associated transferase 1